MKKNLLIGLSAVILLQIVVLVAEYVNAVYPTWTGQEIQLKTIPVDPRSIFRGNYARLKYEISEIPGTTINTSRIPRNGEVVFVLLNRDRNGICSYNTASLEKPKNGLFIRGRIKKYSSRNKQGSYQVRYGIEAFFAPKEKALLLEKELRDGTLAVIMLDRSGKAALKDIILDNTEP